MKYKILESSTIGELETKVEQLLELGWQLVDGHKVGGTGVSSRYSQTMIKKIESPKVI